MKSVFKSLFLVSMLSSALYAADTTPANSDKVKTSASSADNYQYPPPPPYHIDDTHDTTDIFAIPIDNSEEEDELELKSLNKTAREEKLKKEDQPKK